MSSFEMEYESKLAIPDDITNKAVLIRLFDGVMPEIGPIGSDRFIERRRIQYYDLSTFLFAIKGWTVRRVGVFGKEHQANYRFDMKIGPVDTPERQEKNRWHDRRLTPDKVVRLLEIERYRAIVEAFNVRMRYDKTRFGFQGARIEASLDEVRDQTNERVLLRELEFELQSGSPEALEALMLVVRQHFPADQFPNIVDRLWKIRANLLANGSLERRLIRYAAMKDEYPNGLEDCGSTRTHTLYLAFYDYVRRIIEISG